MLNELHFIICLLQTKQTSLAVMHWLSHRVVKAPSQLVPWINMHNNRPKGCKDSSFTCLMRVLCCLSALLASLRYSATLSSLAVCSILICSVSLRIFCCSWAMACFVRCGSGVPSSLPGNELSAPHETDSGVWPRPLTSSRSIWSMDE